VSPLTKQFLAYNKKPKLPSVVEVAKELPAYPIEGFISKEETILDRMGRLVEAKAKGYWLSPANHQFFVTHRGLKRGTWRCKLGCNNRRSLRRDEERYRRMIAQTKLCYRG
jgi:hypothetical protein